MEIATSEMLRTLRYVRTLVDRGAFPTPEQLTAYANAALPQTVLVENTPSAVRMAAMWDHHYESVNTVGNYLVQVQWIEVTVRGVELTQLGRAIDATADDVGFQLPEPSIINIVLQGNDPISYGAFIEAIQRVRGDSEVLLVDPYLPSAHLPALIANAGVTRVLTTEVDVRDAKETRENRTQAFALTLGTHADRNVEIRYAVKGALHDRLVLPTSGAGLMVGRSLGGRQMTAVVELNAGMTASFRDHHERIWELATAVSAVDLSHVVGGDPTPP